MAGDDPKTSNVFLVGLMGAGKSTVGKRLARALGLPFVDADREIEARTGVTIPVIFDIEGEAGFRDREERAIDELSARDGLVLAAGGGAVLRPASRERLRARGLVVYLRAPLDLLHARTRHDRRRPLLNTADPRARLAELHAEREPLYLECADLIVDTDRRTVRDIVETVRRERERLCGR